METASARSREETSVLPARRAILKPKRARPFHGRHPWVLDSAIHHVEREPGQGDPGDGDEVDLLSDQGKWIARGLYCGPGRIRLRLYSWNEGESLDAPFWRRRLEAAFRARTVIGYDDRAGAARVVFSEADGLSGLIVDRFADCLAVQITSLAVAKRREDWLPALVEWGRPRAIVVRVEREAAKLESIPLEQGLVYGELADGPVFIEEHGVRYGVDLAEGQKTGFYLDQRENRRVAAGWTRNRRVLDVCCFTGAFSLCASKVGGAREVLGIDSSAKAIALAKAHAELNGIANVRFEVGDCFERLQSLVSEGVRFGAVILDPPKFAHRRESAADALRAYERLNRLAVAALAPEGMLITCSCSGHISREDFRHMLAEVAHRSGRELRILEQRGASLDHAVSATCLESEYLKCFVVRVS